MKPSCIYEALSNLPILNLFKGTIGCVKLCNGKGQQEKKSHSMDYLPAAFLFHVWLEGRKFYVNLDTWLTK